MQAVIQLALCKLDCKNGGNEVSSSYYGQFSTSVSLRKETWLQAKMSWIVVSIFFP